MSGSILIFSGDLVPGRANFRGIQNTCYRCIILYVGYIPLGGIYTVYCV